MISEAPDRYHDFSLPLTTTLLSWEIKSKLIIHRGLYKLSSLKRSVKLLNGKGVTPCAQHGWTICLRGETASFLGRSELQASQYVRVAPEIWKQQQLWGPPCSLSVHLYLLLALAVSRWLWGDVMLWSGSYHRGLVLIHSLPDWTVLRGKVHLQKFWLVVVLRHFLLFLSLSVPSLAHSRLCRADHSQADGTEAHAYRTGVEGSAVILCDIHQHTWKER